MQIAEPLASFRLGWAFATLIWGESARSFARAILRDDFRNWLIRDGVNGLLLTGSPRFRDVSLEDATQPLPVKQSAGG